MKTPTSNAVIPTGTAPVAQKVPATTRIPSMTFARKSASSGVSGRDRVSPAASRYFLSSLAERL
jgi:hypothetical protein